MSEGTFSDVAAHFFLFCAHLVHFRKNNDSYSLVDKSLY